MPCFWESAEITALTLKLPTMPVMFATGEEPVARLTLPGMVGALNGTVWLLGFVVFVEVDVEVATVLVPPGLTIWMPATLLTAVNASESERETPLLP